MLCKYQVSISCVHQVSLYCCLILSTFLLFDLLNINKFVYCYQAFSFQADKELLRQARIIRVGLIQNSTVLPTTAHYADQKHAIIQKVKLMIDAAGASGVNVLCLQVSSVLKLIE